MTEPFDPGLQPERTELAWRRTSLALGVGSLVAMRLLPEAFGHGLWVLCGVVGVATAAAMWVAARRRYIRVNDALTGEGDRAQLGDGKLPLMLSVLVTVAAVISVILVLAVQ